MPFDTCNMSIKTLLAPFNIDAPDIAINELVLDSRDVAIHKGFVAVKGHTLDGRDFIPQAISLGAKVILTESEEQATHGHIEMREQTLLIYFYQLASQLSALAARFYHNPSNKLDVIAVTGTNGKTSTVQLITQLRHLLGDKAASIGTLGTGVFERHDSELLRTPNTTPDPVRMQALLAQYAEQGVQQVAVEASSHALVQGRMTAVNTRTAIFTNLSRDHLDYHGSMSEYARAKRRLMHQPGLSHLVLNGEDREAKIWLEHMPASVCPVLYGLGDHARISSEAKYCVARQVNYKDGGCAISLDTSWGNGEVFLPLLGRFNVSNYLAALSALLCNGFRFDALLEHTQALRPVAGRMEVFTPIEGDTHTANVVVDYAHTPDALKQALTALRHHCKGKLFCVFGCGGDRDTGKRPLMGEVAEQFSDRIYLTADNSRSEATEDIIEQILSGCTHPEKIAIEPERTKAIRQAIAEAQADDLILVAGKGHEDYQISGGQTLAYNEREYIKNYLKEKRQ